MIDIFEPKYDEKYYRWVNKRIAKYPLKCLCYSTGNPIDGYESECEYEKPPDCDNCICNGGQIDPRTGKRANIRNWKAR